MRILNRPEYDSPELNRIANLMYMILLYNGGFIVFLLLGFLAFGIFRLNAILPILLSLLLYVILFVILQMGHVRLSAVLFVSLGLILITGFVLAYGGVNSPFLFLYFVFIIIASAVLKPFQAMVVYVLVMISGFAMYFLERTEIIKMTFVPVIDISPLIILATNLVVSGSVVYLSNRSFREVLSRVMDSEKKLVKLNNEIVDLNDELLISYDTTLEGWAKALELKDKETEGHSRRVTDLTWLLAKEYGVPEDDLIHIRYGALLHDIGKMGIPDEILNKPGPLTEEEFEVVKRHPVIAYNLLKEVKFLHQALVIPYSHHENWDGTGYPEGLANTEIPLAARIFAVVDNWDALTSERPYRKAWTREATLEYIREQSGKKFDPQMVELFLRVMSQMEFSDLEPVLHLNKSDLIEVCF